MTACILAGRRRGNAGLRRVSIYVRLVIFMAQYIQPCTPRLRLLAQNDTGTWPFQGELAVNYMRVAFRCHLGIAQSPDCP